MKKSVRKKPTNSSAIDDIYLSNTHWRDLYMNQAHRKSFGKHMCTISHNIDGETECHKLKFRGNFKNCLIKCANTVSKELIFHTFDKHT